MFTPLHTGDAVGSEVVGEIDGETVGDEGVGEIDGDTVGSGVGRLAVVGATEGGADQHTVHPGRPPPSLCHVTVEPADTGTLFGPVRKRNRRSSMMRSDEPSV